jgi:hypothetical protein
VVLYEALTGAKPITGKDTMSIIAGHLQRPPRSFEETDTQQLVPPAMRAAVLKALEKQPQDRFQTAEEFAEALRETVTPRTEIVELPEVAPAMERKLSRWVAVAAVVAVVVLGGIAARRFRSSPSPEPVAEATVSNSVVSPMVNATVPGTSVTVTAVPVMAPAEAGQLLINALPWGAVTSVTDAAGTERLSAPAETPLMLSLPPGSYKVHLSNPNSRRAVVLDATVTANMLSRCEVELDRVDAATYIEGIGH